MTSQRANYEYDYHASGTRGYISRSVVFCDANTVAMWAFTLRYDRLIGLDTDETRKSLLKWPERRRPDIVSASKVYLDNRVLQIRCNRASAIHTQGVYLAILKYMRYIRLLTIDGTHHRDTSPVLIIISSGSCSVRLTRGMIAGSVCNIDSRRSK
ncbi:hypothetical protein BD311DRAFT_265860 [Dichomitus squalens]|uniref:Uncharacterized protein n=1 Tax=Dichomitus squalens TaxID=114155 RepID=A0A4Q9MR90_9APHY|nr:hypothetical protein BD311DRAFT_265860 [Dichomitus squalens]